MNALFFLKIRAGIITAIVFLSSIFSLYGQKDMRGTDFWLTFGANNLHLRNDEGYLGPLNLQIRIVSRDKQTSGTIYFTNLDTTISFTIPAQQVYTHNLSIPQKRAVYITQPGVSNFSVHIITDNPVTAYALNQTNVSADATNLLPVTALGKEYYQISYIPRYNTDSYDAYAVVATQNNTQLYHNHENILITLNAGDVYYKTSLKDMTGINVSANKPVAFFAINQGVLIPENGGSGDCLVQQLAPVNTWGKNFFVPVSDLTTSWYWDTKDRVRIIASQNNTTITQTGGTLITNSGGKTSYTLQAGEFIELEVNLNNNGCYIQANKLIGVCTYLTSSDYNNGSFSDPAQAWLPSIEQLALEAVIAPFIPTGYSRLDAHKALIITPTATKDSTTVKIGTNAAQALSGGKWYDNLVSGMSFYSLPLTNDTTTYLISNWHGGLIIMGYGTGFAESYYYLAFSAMRSLNAVFYINGIHYQEVAFESICTQPIQFSAKIEGDTSTDPGYLKWYINDIEEIAARDQLTWNKTFAPDTYNIKMVVLMDNNISTRTLESILIIDTAGITNVSGNTTICVGNTVFLKGTPEGGRWESVNHTFATVDSRGNVKGLSAGDSEIKYIMETTGCTDTASMIIHVTLTTIDAKTTPEICRRENGTISLTVNSDALSTVKYVWNGFSDTTPVLFNLKEGTYRVTVSDSFCVVDKNISIEHVDAPVANFEFANNIVHNNPFFLTDLSQGTVQTWEWDMGDGNQQTGKSINHNYPKPGDYKIFLKVTDINGCTDSIVKIIHIYDDLVIFIPNIFTPNSDGTNDVWKPEMSDYSKEGYQLSIFDRWGQCIFHTTDTETAWDGTTNGKYAASNTVYSYQIIVKNIMNKEYKFTGKITLMR